MKSMIPRNNRIGFASLALAMLFFLAGCPGGPPTPPPNASCDIDSWTIERDTTLYKRCAPYRVTGRIAIKNDAVLTLEPGVILLFDASGSLTIEGGQLVAEGTAKDPIVFASSEAQPTPGSWNGLYFGGGTLDGTALNHVAIQHAGDNKYGACLTLYNTPEGRVSVTNSTFDSCKQTGLHVAGKEAPKVLQGLMFKNLKFGLSMNANAIRSLADAAKYEGVRANEIHGGDVLQSATWIGQSVPWHVANSFSVQDKDQNPILTLEAGVQLLFNSGKWLNIGYNHPGGLVAQGSKDSPVIFGSSLEQPTPGSWGNVYFGGKTLNGTSITHAIFRDGGSNKHGACLWIESAPEGRMSITNTAFDSCKQTGLHVAGKDAPKVLQSLTFKNMTYGMSLDANAIRSLVDAAKYESVGQNRLHGGNVLRSATWIGQSVPWHVANSFSVQEETEKPVLTLEAGVQLLFDTGKWLNIGYNHPGGLVAQGSKDNPVIFGSSLKQPTPGSWGNVYFGGKTLNGTSITHAIFRDGGSNKHGACLWIESAPEGRMSITNTAFDSCKQTGLHVAGKEAPKVLQSLTFKNMTYGLSMNANVIGSLVDAAKYENVKANEIHSGNVLRSATWIGQSVPWIVANSISVQEATENPVLTLEAGVQLLFDEGKWLNVGYNHPGGLVAKGSASDPVVFGSSLKQPTPGSWGNVYFGGKTLNGTNITHAIFRDGGSNKHGTAVWMESTSGRVSILNSTFENNKKYDLWHDCKSQPKLQGNQYKSSSGLYKPSGC